MRKGVEGGAGRIIAALDITDIGRVTELVLCLKERIKIFKVGSILFSAHGTKAVDIVRENGCEVFLDLKFHDIPNTVAKTCANVCAMKIFMFNVHALGGSAMLKAAAETCNSICSREAIRKPLLIAVTILTSFDRQELNRVNIVKSVLSEVKHLAKLSKECGLDGVVSSVREVKDIKRICGADFVCVTPGVRLTQENKDDQKRVQTPYEAFKQGADYIVVGRPIIEAKDPVKAAKEIINNAGGECVWNIKKH